jgi:hypothetical protein
MMVVIHKSSEKQYKTIMIRIIALVTIVAIVQACDNSTSMDNSMSLNKRNHLDEGGEIAQNVFQVLSSELKQALDSGGVSNAINYCNLNALSITDSMSKKYGVEIRRTSQFYRNPKNSPTIHETKVLSNYQQLINNGGAVSPFTDTLDDGRIQFHSPIFLAPLCSKCHGDVESEIGSVNDSIIKQHYPKDLATGFKIGELRGMWSIIFEE